MQSRDYKVLVRQALTLLQIASDNDAGAYINTIKYLGSDAEPYYDDEKTIQRIAQAIMKGGY